MHAAASQELPGFCTHPVVIESKVNGIVLRSTVNPVESFHSLQEMLEAAAAAVPDQVFLQQNATEGSGRIESVTYAEALRQVDQYGRGLIECGLSPERPLAILSGNSINHALLALGAMSVGIPVAPISVAYSLMPDLERLENILNSLTPGLVYAESWVGFQRALSIAGKNGTRLVVSDEVPPSGGVWTLEMLSETGLHSPAIRSRFPVGPDTIAKVLFTSGSTGAPKGAIVTQRMMCSNQEALSQCWPFLLSEPPVVVDWLPWNHVFGGCLIFNAVLRHRGMMVIDEGRPVGEQFDSTKKNIVAHSPTIHLSVPRALDELVNAMRKDELLCERFFRRLRLIFSAGAGLPKATWEALHELARKWCPHEVRIVISYGSTETAPVVCVSTGQSILPNNIGTPIPGSEIKLAPVDDKYEIRVRGPMVTPGYWRRPELVAEIFDEEGFYRMGDAGKLECDDRPGLGILFDGRVAEDFKLVTGTWVRTTNLRITCVSALAPLVQDVVVAGQDRDEIGILIFINLGQARKILGRPDASFSDCARSTEIRDAIGKALISLNQGASSSSRIARALVLDSAPLIDAGEITDKGYINQRAVLRRRADEVERLYSPTNPDVITPAES
ncbi:feruloyl-CoA synthase [Herbaspirillum sp.]|uniref:feruloyl-CoA synthase n=1 Tax=Herbaspirillum sp. TaxID=1890675 RepID=UPI0031E0DC02